MSKTTKGDALLALMVRTPDEPGALHALTHVILEHQAKKMSPLSLVPIFVLGGAYQRADGDATWRHALIGSALIVIPALGTRLDPALLGVASLAGATLYLARGRRRVALLVLAVGVLFGARIPAHPPLVAPLVGAVAAGAGVLGANVIARVWRPRPQVATWAAFATLLVTCAYTFAFDATTVALRVPFEIAAIAVAYLGICVVAGRIRRAELIARPAGVLSIPQSIVPLLDRSHDHAVICWSE